MIEAYKIGVSMILDQGRILGPLGEIAQAYERLENSQKNIQGGINQMAAGYRAAAKAARELADAVERVNRAQAGGSASGARAAAPGAFTGGIMAGAGMGVGGGSAPRSGRIASGPPALMLAGPAEKGGGFYQGGPFNLSTGLERPLNVVDLGLPNPPSVPPRVPPEKPAAHDYMVAGATLTVGAYADASFLEKIFKAGLDVGAVQSNLLTQRFTPEQVTTALQKAKETQRSITGSTVGGNLEIASMLMAITQNASAAIELMPEYSKLAVAMNASGHGSQIAELNSAMQGAELRGILFKKDKKSGEEVLDKDATKNFLHEVLSISAMTHGRVGPAQLTQFLQSSGIAGMMLSDDDIAASLPLILSMKPSGAGTALSGFSQQFSAGKMSEAAMNMLADMGIIKDKTKARKMGMGQFMMLPGAMDVKDVNMSRFHPAEFIMDRLLPQVEKYETKMFEKAFTGADEKTQMAMIAAAFQQIASRIPGGKEMAEVVRNNPLILRDVKAYHDEMKVDVFGTQVANNPKVALEGFNAAWNAFLISLAGPNMKTGTNALSDLTHALNYLSAEIDAHPNQARMLIDVAAGMGAVAAGVGTLLLAIAPLAAFFKIGKWALSSGAAETAAKSSPVGRMVGLGVGVGMGAAEFATWMDKQFPALRRIDNWTEKQFGNTVQPVTVNLTNNTIVDSKVVQKSVTSSIVQGLRSNASPVSGDQRAVATPPGAVAQ